MRFLFHEWQNKSDGVFCSQLNSTEAGAKLRSSRLLLTVKTGGDDGRLFQPMGTPEGSAIFLHGDAAVGTAGDDWRLFQPMQTLRGRGFLCKMLLQYEQLEMSCCQKRSTIIRWCELNQLIQLIHLLLQTGDAVLNDSTDCLIVKTR